ncbi:MAG: Crp/Fnr family transcriptional regulator [Coriobacteriales bacterium]|jgi:CRP/FNR family transcriptional regulator|nr:Crp/Fnr family transcriptional regulator [Coriobacteriales bacterium]
MQSKTSDRIKTAAASSVLLDGLELNASNAALQSFRRGQLTSDSLGGKPACGLIVSGCFDVYCVAVDGHEVCLNRLCAGDCFGIANLFGAEDPSGDLDKGEDLEPGINTVLKCRERSTVLFFAKQVLREALTRDLRLANRFLRLYSRKTGFLLQRIEQLSMHFASGKLSGYLLEREAGRQYVDLEVTKEELASQLGVSRASLYRELSRLKELGAIVTEKQRIRILNPQVLKQSALQDG